MSENPPAFDQRPPATAEEPGKTRSLRELPWDRILIWTVIAVAFALIVAAAVLLFLGLLELIAIVSPVLIAGLLVWSAWLTLKTLSLDRRLREQDPQRASQQ
jgi:hypothetical protein